jgi:VanZ family protein
VVAILGLGSAEFSAAHTSRYLLPLLRWFFPELPVRTYVEIAAWIRKSAHVIEYALLGALAVRALWLSLARQNPFARTALLAIGLAASVALADEIRQSTLPTRTGSPWDVALDVSGALAAIALTLWWKRRARARAAAAGPA